MLLSLRFSILVGAFDPRRRRPRPVGLRAHAAPDDRLLRTHRRLRRPPGGYCDRRRSDAGHPQERRCVLALSALTLAADGPIVSTMAIDGSTQGFTIFAERPSSGPSSGRARPRRSATSPRASRATRRSTECGGDRQVGTYAKGGQFHAVTRAGIAGNEALIDPAGYGNAYLFATDGTNQVGGAVPTGDLLRPRRNVERLRRLVPRPRSGPRLRLGTRRAIRELPRSAPVTSPPVPTRACGRFTATSFVDLNTVGADQSDAFAVFGRHRGRHLRISAASTTRAYGAAPQRRPGDERSRSVLPSLYDRLLRYIGRRHRWGDDLRRGRRADTRTRRLTRR